MTLTATQLGLRRTGIGGSEIAAVVGLNPWRSPLDVYLSKVEGWEQEDNAAMERGRFLEDGVAQWYAHRTGVRLETVSTLPHYEKPLALCTPDRFILRDGQPIRLLSIKVPGPYTREEWGEPGTDEVPMPYLLQLQWEWFVVSSLGPVDGEMHLAAPINGDLAVFVIRADRELQASLYAQAERFWKTYVERRTPPDIDGSETADLWLQKRFPRNREPFRVATLDEEALALRLREDQLAFDLAEAGLKTTKNRIKEAIGTAEGIEGAFGRITWRANKNGIRSLKTTWRRDE